MLERYTEKARRVIFFARYEATQRGCHLVESEHLLLGLVREDRLLANRFLAASADAICELIESLNTAREKVSTAAELPLSIECKRILSHAAGEAEHMRNKHTGTEHLLLGILREEKCRAAKMLFERGLRLQAIREELMRSTQEKL